MRFNNDFKITYWLIAVITLSIFLFIRLEDVTSIKMVSLDPYIFIFWCVLVAIPLFNEISFGGFTFKREFEKFSDDIRKQILDIRLDNSNHNDNRSNSNVYLNLEYSKAEKEEYKDKLSRELKDDENSKINYFFDHEEKRPVISRNEKVQFKLEKISRIEELVRKRLTEKYGDNFSSEMKVENNLGNKVILDGIVFYRENKIKEVVEIKFISSKSSEYFKFTWGRLVNKLVKLGMDKPIKLIVVSEEMDQGKAYKIQQDLNFVSILRKDLKKEFRMRFEFFRFENNELIEVNAQKNLEPV